MVDPDFDGDLAEAALCQQCRSKPGCPADYVPHLCPTLADLDGDSETMCNCCRACSDGCADYV